MLAKALESRGCDFIHVSTSELSPLQQIPVAEHFQVPFAETIKAEVNTPLIAVGLITDAKKAETILTQGQADAIALARTVLYDPHWPWRAAATLVTWCNGKSTATVFTLVATWGEVADRVGCLICYSSVILSLKF